MRRKSERNKGKASSEKKVEKPTRRTTRRRGKASPSTSPERENADDNVSSTPYSDEEKERLQTRDERNDKEEIDKGVSSSELIKSVLGGDEEDNGSVWKVARADASPGEIQKLKLCRQRNISEASDSSLSKKKSNKWPDSGEGGMEEVDSADEQIASSQKMLISEQTDDVSSWHPGQDSQEEVSDYKENLPETTSANLSDDKPNIDQLTGFEENLSETTSTNLPEAPNYEDNQSSDFAANPPYDNSYLDQAPDSRDKVAEFISEDVPNDQQNQDFQEDLSKGAGYNSNETESHQHFNDQCIGEAIHSIKENVQIEENLTANKEFSLNEGETIVEEMTPMINTVLEQNSPPSEETAIEDVSNGNDKTVITNILDSNQVIEHEEEEEEGEIREEAEKETSSKESDSVSNTRDESDIQGVEPSQTPSTKTHFSHLKHSLFSTSNTPESDDEKNTTKSKETQRKKVNSNNGEAKVKKSKKKNEKEKTRSFDKENKTVSKELEVEISESNTEKEDILEISEKSDDLSVTLSTSKPAKVSLKRSFSTRLSTDTETKKDENNSKKVIVNESNQNKENHADNELVDHKSATKRRRWGMTASSDVAPAFSISTDSLKALVPGAKPLSANEVRLTKDEDDEKEPRKNRNEVSGDHKSKNDLSSKSDVKKTELKTDNHIAPRRKITVVKETPRPTSPSPPEAQATNILLIRNLVRPFTLNQIKELLSRTGTIIENGFWMDRIKSKCFVEYANEDQAFETRQALHGVSWPLSNPKKLIVDYAKKEDMETARETSIEQPLPRKVEPVVSSDPWEKYHWARDEEPPVVNKITVIREWDLGKEDGQLHVKEKERDRKEYEKKKRQRSRSPIRETHLPAPARKFKKKEEEPPTAKLLDDLFRKTKSTPCIYWLPLTNEQIIVKEEMRRQHMAEHARRFEEMRRAERNRDPRRRRSPRK